MNLYEVNNHYVGNGNVRCLIIADKESRALELAEIQFKKSATNDNYNPNIKECFWNKQYEYPENYWTVLTATVLCRDINKEWVGEVED